MSTEKGARETSVGGIIRGEKDQAGETSGTKETAALNKAYIVRSIIL